VLSYLLTEYSSSSSCARAMNEFGGFNFQKCSTSSAEVVFEAIPVLP